MRARRTKIKGVVESRSSALAMVGAPGDFALVERGKLRAIVIQCPDGCGEKLTINLDPDAGPSWRLYRDHDRYTLYPSIWRTTGCRSHFIIWSDLIYWMDWRDPKHNSERLLSVSTAVLERLRADSWMSVEALASEIQQNPWLVASVCQTLKRRGVIEETVKGGSYRMRTTGNHG